MNAQPVAKPVSGIGVRFGLAIALGWVLLYAIGLLGSQAEHASLWFPPSALSFVALLVVGARAAPWLLLGIVLVTLSPLSFESSEVDWLPAISSAFVFGAAHLASYGASALVLRRLARRADHKLPMIVIDFLLVAVSGSLLASLVGPLALIVTGLMEPAAFRGTWLAFWVGDMVALVTLAPALAAFLLRRTPAPRFRIDPLETDASSRRTRFLIRLLTNALVISAAMMLPGWLGTLESTFAIFVLLLPQMWLTFSEHPRRTAQAMAFNSLVIVGWLFVLDLDPYVFVYQFAIAIIATVAYFGVAIPLLAEDNVRLRESVMVDRLTGAASREFLERQVALELQRAERSGSPLCLLVIDLDRFKSINDELGHAHGDRVLADVNTVVRDVLRSGDVLARFGGDEFVALLTGTGPQIGEEVAERMLRAIAEVRVVDGRELTASIGLTAYVPGDDFAALFERADRALYDAKRSGRETLRARYA
ncbi:diguanylate cyclase domain-containing protein [Halomonas denitrificans]|nr:diguanylate cyclase [Halomonas denitrificans]